MDKDIDKMELLKQRLYDIADSDQRTEMDKIFSREIEIPVSGEYDIESDPTWWDINDYM